MKTALKSSSLSLAGYAAVCTLLIALVHQLTRETIIEQRQRVLLDTLSSVLPASVYDNRLIDDCIWITDKAALGNDKPHQLYRAYKAGKPVAAIIETTAADGYTGSIALMTAYTVDGTVTGVRVLQHRETPGLGDKIDERKSDWITRFNGHRIAGENDKRWAVKKDDGIFDQFTGATITPRAVVKAVKNTGLYFAQNQAILFSTQSNCDPEIKQ